MSFDAATFWLFFAVAWLLWRGLSFSLAKSAALFLSLFFYAWWNPWYLPLILGSALVDFLVCRRMTGASALPRRFWLTLSMVCNLGLLGVFKYGAAVTGMDTWWVVPIGISFYTFQTMSYTIDVYRGTLQPARSFRDYLLFVSFFPQLVAGPIIRASELLPQLERRPRITPLKVQKGVYEIIWGLFMKIVVADSVARPATYVFHPDNFDTVTPLLAWVGVISFSVQIFADFAGYSAIAIGLANLMGLSFPRNFRYPYISCSLSEFWRRWHITLSQWLRDYLYVSLGGNRRGSRRTYFNLMVVMLLGGLWHGSAWTFVAWGGIHGLGLCLERALRGGRSVDESRRGGVPGQALKMLAVYVFVLVTWVFFRAEGFGDALFLLRQMFVTPWSGELGDLRFVSQWPVQLTAIGVVFALHGAHLVEDRLGRRPSPYLRAALAATMLMILLVFVRTHQVEFIYFQF